MIKDLLTEEFLNSNTIPSNIKYGTEIYQRGGVAFIDKDVHEVEAWVGGLSGTVVEGAGSRRRVKLSVLEGSLRWTCTGNPKKHQIFCKHCVALALALRAE
jgi:uncharacterized Zn finger protein